MENKEELQAEEQVLQQDTDNQTVGTEENTPEVENKEASQLENLSIELAELKDKYIRLYSDFDNFRKRTAKEKLDMIQSASEGVIRDILPVVDDIERAVANAQEGEISEGVTLIFNKLNHALTSKGLKPMDAKGDVFNPDLHEGYYPIPFSYRGR
jgi:molecular chaperone GrpE